MRPKLAKHERRSNNVLLCLNERERDALDRLVKRLRPGAEPLEYQTCLRTLILAAERGDLPVNPALFQLEP